MTAYSSGIGKINAQRRAQKLARADYDPERVDMRIEGRQGKLAANAEAIERWQRKLFRAANELQKLVAARKRLLITTTLGHKTWECKECTTEWDGDSEQEGTS